MNHLLTVSRRHRDARPPPPRQAGRARFTRQRLAFAMTWDECATRLANAPARPRACAKGDRVALLAYNCVEWMEIYVALARGRAGRGADQLPPGRPGDRLHRRSTARRGPSSCRTTWSSASRRSATSSRSPPSGCIHFGDGDARPAGALRGADRARRSTADARRST